MYAAIAYVVGERGLNEVKDILMKSFLNIKCKIPTTIQIFDCGGFHSLNLQLYKILQSRMKSHCICL